MGKSGGGGKAKKRRRESSSEGDSHDVEPPATTPNHDENLVGDDGGQNSDLDGRREEEGGVRSTAPAEEHVDNGRDDDDDEKKQKKKKKKVRKLSLKATEDFNAKLRRRGVLYLSRIPPRMGPSKVKSLLSDFGTVTRVYLVEEDKSARKRRRKLSGGKSGAGGKRYTEGWVEFEDKKVAELVGERLNNTPITNHKRSVHYGDLWNVKYLRKFRWEHLTEKVAYERRVREQKMRVELMHARRENAAYAEKVERGMVLDRIEERRKKKRSKTSADVGGGSATTSGDGGKPARKFRQTAVVEEDQGGPAKSAVLGSLV